MHTPLRVRAASRLTLCEQSEEAADHRILFGKTLDWSSCSNENSMRGESAGAAPASRTWGAGEPADEADSPGSCPKPVTHGAVSRCWVARIGLSARAVLYPRRNGREVVRWVSRGLSPWHLPVALPRLFRPRVCPDSSHHLGRGRAGIVHMS